MHLSCFAILLSTHLLRPFFEWVDESMTDVLTKLLRTTVLHLLLKAQTQQMRQSSFDVTTISCMLI